MPEPERSMKMRISREALKRRIANDPDDLECEAGLPEPQCSIEELVVDLTVAAIGFGGCTKQGCHQHEGELADARAALTRAVARLREENVRLALYARHLPGCAVNGLRPVDAPANLCSCGFVGLPPEGRGP